MHLLRVLSGSEIDVPKVRLFLVALLAGSGVMHFVRPAPFVAIVPKALPRPERLVAVSGAAEIACAGLLASPATRRWGGPVTAALFAAVYPANVSMLLRSGGRPWWYRAALVARLPLQVPLVLWALRVGRSGTG
jgi:uncharacterized membrane protein